MSASLRPTEIHKRQRREEKRRRLRARLIYAPAHERSIIEAKIQKTYPLLGAAPKPAAKK